MKTTIYILIAIAIIIWIASPQTLKNKFWKWLSLFAYKQIKGKSDVIKYGMPGIRDVDHKCSSFMPGIFTDRGFNHCDGDGHYLCKTCRYYAP